MTVNTDSQRNPPQIPFFSRFQTRLALLVLLVFIPALLLTIFTNLNERKARKMRVEENIASLARLGAASEENFVKSTRQLLAVVSQVSFLVLAADRTVCEFHLKNLRTLSPDYLDFGLIEANGILFCSAAMTNGTADLSDTAHFQRVFQEKRFSIGNFQRNVMTGKPSLDFGYPIFNERGELYRVLYASLNLSLLNESAAGVPLPADATLTVFDSRGNILVQYPRPDEWVGKALSEEPFVQKILGARKGIFEMQGLDGIEKLFAIAPISDGREDRLFATVHVPTQTLFAEANRALLRNIIVLGIVTTLALVIARFYAVYSLVRPLQALLSAALRLAAGQLNARTGIKQGTGELSELSHAFDEMAGKLERRQREIEAANAEVKRVNAELEERVKDRTSQLEAANQEWEAFSYSVSHDLRAPLRHIDGCAELLRQSPDLNLDDEDKQHLNIVTDSAKRMSRLIDDLLHFSRVGRRELRRQECDLNQMMRDVLKEISLHAEKRNIEWKIESLPRVFADPSLLKQVWANLLSNAVKYTSRRERAEINIGYRVKGEQFEFFIRDNGAGFDMRYADKLFGVFQRLHSDKEFEGTGIGLANVRRIINRHGGHTWADGKVDEGATFYFTLLCSNKNDFQSSVSGQSN